MSSWGGGRILCLVRRWSPMLEVVLPWCLICLPHFLPDIFT